MTWQGWLQILIYVAVLTGLTPLLGGYMARVYMGRRVVMERALGPVERLFYRAVRTNPSREQNWKQYGTTGLVFSALFWLALYAIPRLQGSLPFDPLRFGAAPWNVTFFSNLGPNQKDLADQAKANLDAYLALEHPYTPTLTAAGVPVDAVTTSASGVDPHISIDNARIQANRIAAVRNAPLARVLTLVRQHTDGRALGVLGEPGINVLELNLALDKEFPLR
jgi:K+-transporting ATPase, c chain/Potassium-transporting ATPase A subunit